MFIYEGLENCKKISRIKVAKKLDYTYFKRSSDVNETMKPPKQVDELIEILQKQDFGHRVTFTEEEKEKASVFFTHTNYYRFSIFPRLIKGDALRTFTNLTYLYYADKYIREKLGHFSGILEEWIKTSLVSVISTNYSSLHYQKAEFYLDLDIYSNESSFERDSHKKASSNSSVSCLTLLLFIRVLLKYQNWGIKFYFFKQFFHHIWRSIDTAVGAIGQVAFATKRWLPVGIVNPDAFPVDWHPVIYWCCIVSAIFIFPF